MYLQYNVWIQTYIHTHIHTYIHTVTLAIEAHVYIMNIRLTVTLTTRLAHIYNKWEAYSVTLLAISCKVDSHMSYPCEAHSHLHLTRSFVEWWSTNTDLAHQCSPCENFAHTWSVKLNDIGMGHLWLNGWGIYDLLKGGGCGIYGRNGWGSYEMLKVLREVPFLVIAWLQVSVPLNSRLGGKGNAFTNDVLQATPVVQG